MTCTSTLPLSPGSVVLPEEFLNVGVPLTSNSTPRGEKKMTVTSPGSKGVHFLRNGLAWLAMFQLAIGVPFANAADQPKHAADAATTTPIKTVIVIIGENRSFDHVFATYAPKKGETVSNLLSKGIITEDGTPGPNYSLAAQYSAVD